MSGLFTFFFFSVLICTFVSLTKWTDQSGASSVPTTALENALDCNNIAKLDDDASLTENQVLPLKPVPWRIHLQNAVHVLTKPRRGRLQMIHVSMYRLFHVQARCRFSFNQRKRTLSCNSFPSQFASSTTSSTTPKRTNTYGCDRSFLVLNVENPEMASRPRCVMLRFPSSRF